MAVEGLSLLALLATGGVDQVHAAGGFPAQYHAMVPARLIDTRTGLGGRNGPIGPEETASYQIAGANAVPALASAVR